MQGPPPGFDLQGVLSHLSEYAASFLTTGAVGFRYWVLRGRVRGVAQGTVAPEGRFDRRAANNAAVIGLIGALIGLPRYWMMASRTAGQRGVSVPQAILDGGRLLVPTLLILVLIVGFALAASRVPLGWPLAALAVLYAVVGPVTALLSGDYGGAANPIHVLGGGLWIGTLFVMTVAGVGPLLRDPALRSERGPVTARMVHTFSPLALVCGLVVALTGVINGVLEVGSFPALWTTPYGKMLLVKLVFVAAVFALGAWNWRRVRPTLGSEDTAVVIHRSARKELLAAAAVLVATALMLSFPAPNKPEGPPGGGPPPAPAH